MPTTAKLASLSPRYVYDSKGEVALKMIFICPKCKPLGSCEAQAPLPNPLEAKADCGQTLEIKDGVVWV